MTKQKYLIEHLLRLNTTIKLFQYSATSKVVFEECKEFTKELPLIIDDIVLHHQLKVNTLLSFQIGEVISIDNDTLMLVLESSQKYVSENTEGINITALNKFDTLISKFIYNIKFLS